MPRLIPDIKGYRFSIYSGDCEKPHLHVKKAGNEAKFWLTPVSLNWNRGYSNQEIAEIDALVRTNQNKLVAKYKKLCP